MYFSIRHLTKFLYKSAVSESIMETRMHPRSDANQRCLTFHLSVSPRCRVFSYRDHLANHIHHFDIPGQHGQLVIVAESLVEMQPHIMVPEALPTSAWDELDRQVHEGDFWEMLLPSEFAAPSAELEALADRFNLRRRDDPLSVLHKLNKELYHYFDYKPKSTKADSPIDLALSTRAGVCQDFAHIMIALVRTLVRRTAEEAPSSRRLGILRAAPIARLVITIAGFAIIVPLLFISGLSRSMQFTTLSTLAFAEVPQSSESARQ